MIVISSELPELLSLSDRIGILKRGRLIVELDAATTDEATVVSYAAAGKSLERGDGCRFQQGRARNVSVGRLGSLLGLIVSCSLLAIFNEQFRSFTNYLLLLQQAAPIAIIAVGQTFVILTGGIDLSVGSLTAFTSVCMALSMTGGTAHFYPPSPWLAIALGICVATAVGAAQGVLITKLRMPPFIVTLGSFNAFAGLALVLTNGCAISVLRYTRLGRYAYAIGGNEQAVRLSGAAVDRYKIAVYGIS